MKQNLKKRGTEPSNELWPNRWQREEVVSNLHDYYQQFQDGTEGDQ